MITLGISCYFHDSAACVLKDGVVIAAAAEERFSRIKHDNTFPLQAISFCLDRLGIAINEVDQIVFYEKPILKFERILHQHLAHFPKSIAASVQTTSSWFDHKLQIDKNLQQELSYYKTVYFVQHHLSHAASSYYLSGFKEAVILTLDGVGEWSTTTLGHAKGKNITIDKEIRYPHSLGLLYSTITTYLGFSANNSEYKVMGLAAYGDPEPFSQHFDTIITQFDDGSYQLNLEYFAFEWSTKTMFSHQLSQLFGHTPRKPGAKLYAYHQNIAAALQAKLEQVVINLLNRAYETYQLPNLCLAGGVALNSVLNGKILSQTLFQQLYIPPDPGDAGGAMGAALYVDRQMSATRRHSQSSFSPHLGPRYEWHQIQQAFNAAGLEYTVYPSKKKLLSFAARQISEQKVVGWFQGSMEWGPRALGNRSILASAATPEMKDIINSRVKHREPFRPFAPVILEEYLGNYFEVDEKVPVAVKYMLMVYPFKKRGLKDAPATVHADGSGRLQVLSRADNPLYYDLVDEYRRITNVPIIINTSFNVRGEPIVCTPRDAINCFLKTDIEYLVMDQFVCQKN